ncbi:hypothetical protein K3495_g3540 [Podosphaera aphanis]|nr:hypothetical protein K3495_g3540 [Podosphaera aphanis]
MAPGKQVVDFNAIVQADRQRRKNQIAAQKIFGKARRRSAPGAIPQSRRHNAVPSLASRVGPAGVTKRTASIPTKPRRAPRGQRSGNVETEWTPNIDFVDDAYDAASHIPPRGPRLLQATHGVPDARIALSPPSLNNQYSIVGNAKPAQSLSIRGLASPFTVIVKNLAAGTTAADIESAMTPVGGVVLGCRLVAERPRVIAEIIFETKEGAENVVETFNNQSADGNILHVYHKTRAISSVKLPSMLAGQHVPLGTRTDLNGERSDDSRSYGYGGSEFCAPTGPSRDRFRDYERDEVLDGSYGFDDHTTGLYSDNIIHSNRRRNQYADRNQGY